VPWSFRRSSLFSQGPGPAGVVNLFASLATAGLVQNLLPLDIGLVIGVKGSGDVEGALKGLAGAGVDHGPLQTNQQRSCDTNIKDNVPE
jgi:hypothetical protein